MSFACAHVTSQHVEFSSTPKEASYFMITASLTLGKQGLFFSLIIGLQLECCIHGTVLLLEKERYSEDSLQRTTAFETQLWF